MQIIFNILITFMVFANYCHYENRVDENDDIRQLWKACRIENDLSYEVFSKAVAGCRKIPNVRNKNIITIIDFSRPSTEKRFYVIDIEKKSLVYKCFVSHGMNSGDNIAELFSNEPESLKSCLGFFLTAETYYGKHGYSLKLDGLEKGINDNARIRDIVIHGADYVSLKYIENHGRLGRSWGCPALPPELTKEIIDMIADGSCLFIFGKDKFYSEHSSFIRKENL